MDIDKQMEFQARYSLLLNLIPQSENLDGGITRVSELEICRALIACKILEREGNVDEATLLARLCSIIGARVSDIRSKKRDSRVASIRQVASYAFRNLLGDRKVNYLTIAKTLGYADHSAAYDAFIRVSRALAMYGPLLEQVLNGDLPSSSLEFSDSNFRTNGLNPRLRCAATLCDKLMKVPSLTRSNLLDVVCKEYGIRPADIQYHRESRTVDAKRVVSYIARERFGMAFNLIAEKLYYRESWSARDCWRVIRNVLMKSAASPGGKITIQ